MENKEQIEKKVQNAIGQLRSMLQADGGDIDYVDMTNQGVVMVRMKGACHGCPHAMATLKQYVERAIREAIPEVKAVEKID